MFTLTCSLTERQIRSDLRKLIFKRGRIFCIYCRSFKIRKIKKEKRYYCIRCRKKFSLFSKTWLEGIKIPLTTFVSILFCWMHGYKIKQANQLLNISIPTIRHYYRLFRINIVENLDFKPENNVQVDEAYFGRFKKQANYFHGKRTYKPPQKVCVAGIGCPSTGQLRTKVIRGRPGKPIKKFIAKNVPKDVLVYSDASPIYTHLRQYGYKHKSQTHDMGFHNAYYIESCWSWMKRSLFSQYHHFTKKYAKEYVAELTWRFNTRKQDKNPLHYLQKLT